MIGEDDCVDAGESDELSRVRTALSHAQHDFEQARLNLEWELAERERAEQLLQAVFEANPAGLAVLRGEELAFEYVNPAYRALTPHPEIDPIGRTYSQIWRADEQLRGRWLIQRLLDTGKSIHVDRYAQQFPDGSTRYFSFDARRLGEAGERAVLITIWDMTRMEQALQRAEQARYQIEEERALLQAIIQNAPEGIQAVDRQNRMILSNTEADRLSSRSEGSKFTAWTSGDILVYRPDGTRYTAEEMPIARAAQHGETTFNQEAVIARPDGERFSVLLNAAPILNQTGELLGGVEVFQDITARKRMEAQLTYQAQLLEKVHDAIVATDERQIISAWNRAAEAMFGWKAEDALGRPLNEVIPPNFSTDEWEQTLQTLVLTGFVQNEITYYSRTGQPIYVEGITMALRSPRGQVTGYLIVNHDITDRKIAEEALRKSEARLRRLVESNILGVSFSHINGDITEANEAFLEVVGYSREDLIAGRVRWTDMTPPEWLDVDSRAVAEAIERGACTPFEKEYIRKNGSRVPVLIGFALLEGSVTDYICFTLDLSDLKRAEAEAQQYAAELERSNQDLQDFAFIASHDMQEPLRKIRSFGERLKSRYLAELGDEGSDYLERMVGAATRMQTMIDDLLSYSRISTKAQPFVPVDLNQAVHDALVNLEGLVEATGGRLELGELPTIEADTMQMRQLFQNLIANALKFHRQGIPPVVRVFQEVREQGIEKGSRSSVTYPLVRICIQDNGIGFDMKFLDRIFQPFQRLHGRSEYEGSGIGLAICRKIVERHHGQITAHSLLGKGTVFTITLPRR